MIIEKCNCCGNEPTLHTTEINVDDEGNEVFEMYWVNCEQCQFETELYYTPEDAYDAWNNGEVTKI